jgi:hypothetical protein
MDSPVFTCWWYSLLQICDSPFKKKFFALIALIFRRIPPFTNTLFFLVKSQLTSLMMAVYMRKLHNRIVIIAQSNSHALMIDYEASMAILEGLYLEARQADVSSKKRGCCRYTPVISSKMLVF